MSAALDYGRGQAALLRRACHERLRAHEAERSLPTSVRFIYYELVQHNPAALVHGGKVRTAGQLVSEALMWLRRHEIVPWNWIVDESRHVTTYTYAATVREYVRDALRYARLDLWAGAAPPLLLCESRTFGGVLERTLAPEYLCRVAATGGQVGGFLHTDLVPILEEGDQVLYIGDYNLAGEQIEANTRKVLEAEVGPSSWERVALLPEHAEGLPQITKKDNRYRPPRPYQSVEVEAYGQSTVTALVRAALDARLPEPLDDVRVRQIHEKDAMAELLDRLDRDEEDEEET